mmetsp:Transcript_12958/g.32716  ORF Transcript_12958/g.32716 Transcript_12958/m.32716 type:complete len:94 (-) Transcript_12958:341-622(-)
MRPTILPSDRCLQPLKVGRPLGFSSHLVSLVEADAMYDDPVNAAVAALANIVVVDVDRNTLRNIFDQIYQSIVQCIITRIGCSWSLIAWLLYR